MCCSGLLGSSLSRQLMLVLSAALASVKAVISARCIGASFVFSLFDAPHSCRNICLEQETLNGFVSHLLLPTAYFIFSSWRLLLFKNALSSSDWAVCLSCAGTEAVTVGGPHFVYFFFLSRLSEPRMFRNLYADKSGMAAQEDRFACLLTANSKFFWFCKNPNVSAEMIG